MKKSGFTLAEVLVTLGLIGVITALTMPSFIANTSEQQHAAKLAATYKVLQDGFAAYMNAKDTDDLTTTDIWSNLDDKAVFYRELGPYIKMSPGGKLSDYYTYTGKSPFYQLNGTSGGIFTNRDYVCQLKNGAYIFPYKMISSMNKSDALAAGLSANATNGYIMVDVNGSQPPNTFGRDVFQFDVMNDGSVEPAGEGSSVVEIVCGNEEGSSFCKALYKCNDENGLACTRQLINNNYKFNY